MNVHKILAELMHQRHKAHPHITFNYVDMKQLIHVENGPFMGPDITHGQQVRGVDTINRTEALQLSAEFKFGDNSAFIIDRLHKTECRIIEQLTANAKGPVTITMPYSGWTGEAPKGNRPQVWSAYLKVVVDNEAQHNTSGAETPKIVKAEVHHPRHCLRRDYVWSRYVMMRVQQRRAAFTAVPRDKQQNKPINVHGAEYGSISFTIHAGSPPEHHVEMILQAEERHHLMQGQGQQCLNYVWYCVFNDAVGEATWTASATPTPLQFDDSAYVNAILRGIRDDDVWCDTMLISSAASVADSLQLAGLERTAGRSIPVPLAIADLLYHEELAWRRGNPGTRYSPIVWNLTRNADGLRTYSASFYVEVNKAQQ